MHLQSAGDWARDPGQLWLRAVVGFEVWGLGFRVIGFEVLDASKPGISTSTLAPLAALGVESLASVLGLNYRV